MRVIGTIICSHCNSSTNLGLRLTSKDDVCCPASLSILPTQIAVIVREENPPVIHDSRLSGHPPYTYFCIAGVWRSFVRYTWETTYFIGDLPNLTLNHGF